MDVVSIRECPDYKDRAIEYFQDKWASEDSMKVYEDSISHCIGARNPLPQWYLLVDKDEIIGCSGIITNDFISRGELYPWLCALFIEEGHRGNNYAKLLIDRAKLDTKDMGFSNLYLCTDHIGYYEKHSFKYLAMGYHPWGESSRIYEIDLD